MYSPIDMLRNTKYGNNYWISYSPKLKRNVKFFSDLEYDNWFYIEINPHIINFCEQPLRISVDVGDKIIDSVFDMWVLYDDNTEEFIEVKYQAELDVNNPKSQRSLMQTSIQREWCLKNNYKYKIMTDFEIRRNLIYLNNIKQIVSQVRNISDIPQSDIIKIIDNLEIQQMKIKQLVYNTGFSLNYIMQLLSWLFYKGICFLGIYDDEIGLETEVYIVDQT